MHLNPVSRAFEGNHRAAVPIRLEFLKSGKLVSGPSERVAHNAGYAITRTSAGARKFSAFLTSKTICGDHLNIHHIDRETLAHAGVFALRRMPVLAADLPPSMVMMRARFIPEAGRGAGGRVFEQAEFWLVERSDWVSCAGRLLAHARDHLVADTDCIDEAESRRLHAEAIRLDRPAENALEDVWARIENASDATLAIVGRILGLRTGIGASRVDFGLTEFSDEASFLSAAALACDVLTRVRPDHPHRAWIEQRLEGLLLWTGSSDPFAGFADRGITFRRSANIAAPSVQRDAVLFMLRRLLPYGRSGQTAIDDIKMRLNSEVIGIQA